MHYNEENGPKTLSGLGETLLAESVNEKELEG